jgi:AraC-like DNA-binding protein
MEPLGQAASFRGFAQRVAGSRALLMEHSTDSIEAERTAQRCRRDDGDEISIDVMFGCQSAVLEHRGTLHLRPGDLCVVDYAQPNRVVRSKHRAAALMLPRQVVHEALGADPAVLAGRRLPGSGIGAVFRSHMRATLDATPLLTPAQSESSVEAAVSLGLGLLLAAYRNEAQVPLEGAGLQLAAMRLIEQSCADPLLAPDRIAQTLGCSRATLYRAFGGSPAGGVAAAIWNARLDRAARLLRESTASVAEVAWCSGFADPATFNRMFRRHFGRTPRETRISPGG